MDSICVKVVEGIHEIFPESEGIRFATDSILGELPDWDSMAAVNLQSYLQQQFNIEVPLELLAEETTLEELAAFLKNPVRSEAV